MATAFRGAEAVGMVSVMFVLMATAATPPAIVTTAGYLVSYDDVETAGWIEVLFGIQLDADERRCAAEHKVLHRPTNQCFRLHHRPPCGPREWLVFDKALAAVGNLTAVCKPRECAPKWGYNARTKMCFEQEKCPEFTTFQYTLFGEGECRCNGTAALGRGEEATCRNLFRPDSCPQGMILAPRYRLMRGIDSTCTPDPCFEEASPTEALSSSTPTTTTTTSTSTAISTTSTTTSTTTTTDTLPIHGGPKFDSDLLVLPKDDSYLGSFWNNWQQPPVHPSHESPWRRATSSGIPAPNVNRGSPSDGISFPNDRRFLLGGSTDPDSEVEVFAPGHPTLHVRTSTRATLGSSNPNRRAAYRTSSGSSYNHYSSTPARWNYVPVYYRRHGAPPRRIQRAAQRDNRSAAARVGSEGRLFGGEDTEGRSVGVSRLLNALVPTPPAPTPQLSPLRVPNLLLPSMGGPSPPSSARRSAANPLKFPLQPKTPTSANPLLATRLGDSSSPVAPPSNVNPLGASPNSANDIEPVEESSYARLNVQYPDGSSMCHTPAQLNISCQLQMVPLFSELSEVRVPLCIDTSFRFAFGRVGKSEDCAENDKGDCAKEVIIKSPEPFDWDLE